MSKRIWAIVSSGTWSYLTDGDHVLSVTLQEYGSCTPADVLNRWLGTLSEKEYEDLAKRVSESKDQLV